MGTFRTLLAVSVLITHSGPIFGVKLLNGTMAVTLFFVVSGFLMSLILTEKYASRGRFYLNRLLRIFPPFWCAVIFTITIGVIIPSGFFREVVSNISAYYESGNLWATAYAATANTLLFGSAIGRRLGSPDYVDVIYSVAGRPEHSFNRMLFVPQAWTLPVELGFYLLAPFVLRCRTSTILVLCTSLVVGSKLVSHYLSHQGVALDTPALLPFQLQYFLFGVLAYRFYVFLRDGALQSRLLCWSFAVLAFGLIAFGYKVTHVLPLNSYAATVGLYALGALCLPFLFMLSKQNPVDALIGELSYPLYLFHFAIAKLFAIGHGLRWVSVENWGITTLVLTLSVSAIYIMIVDRRIEAIRATIAAGDKGKRRVAKAKPTPLPEPLLVPISVPKD